MKKEVFIGIFILFLVSGCAPNVECVPAGCSSQLCVSVDESDIITTCEMKEEYACLSLTECSFVDGECKWIENQEYLDCLEEVNK